MFAFTVDPDRTSGRAVVRVTVLVYAGILLPLVSAVLPRDVNVVWPWVVVACLALAAALALSLSHLGRLPGPRRWPLAASPNTLLVENALAYLAAAGFAYGLSGAVGIYRISLLGPLILVALVGNQAMFVTSYVFCVTALAAVSVGSDTAGVVAPAVIVSYGIGFLGIALLVRHVSTSSAEVVRRSDRFVQLAAIASEASSVRAGLDEMLPIIGDYLEASMVAAYPVTSRRVADDAVAAWPARATRLSDDERSDLRIATVEARPVVRERWVAVPASSTEAVRLVVLVRWKVPRRGSAVDALDIQRTEVPLTMLLTRRDLIDRLQGLTRTDALTALPNRRALSEALDHEFAVAERTASPLSVAMVDIDHFKSYNDTFGHLAGDELLQGLSEMLRSRVRTTDFVARYGGEEFCVVLPFTIVTDAEVVLAELHRRCRELHAERPVTFSAGIAEWDGEESEAELLNRADAALYRAKSIGRARSCLAPAPDARSPVPR